MTKVFIVHGFRGKPNGNWKPWLMEELNKLHVYACALPMPNSEHPQCSEWVSEISRAVNASQIDEIFLVGHSLGVRAVLRFLEDTNIVISGAVLVSGRADESPHPEVASFGGRPFDFQKIKKTCKNFSVIHGDNDSFVPVENAYVLSKELNVDPLIIKNGGHFDREAGYMTFPECLEVLQSFFVS